MTLYNYYTSNSLINVVLNIIKKSYYSFLDYLHVTSIREKTFTYSIVVCLKHGKNKIPTMKKMIVDDKQLLPLQLQVESLKNF